VERRLHCRPGGLGIPTGTIKATVLIETIMAAFEMDEILYELKDHSAGLNCGRWDYIFSFIKRFKNVPGYLFPDRAQITMTRHCMHSYSQLAIKTCHRRGAYAIGGMAAQIPIKNDPEKNREALDKGPGGQDPRGHRRPRRHLGGPSGSGSHRHGGVRQSHACPQPDRPVERRCSRLNGRPVLKLPAGSITEPGMRTNISVGIQYMANWLSGLGCVPLYHLMEDAATAEISRAQLWQWIHHPDAALDDGARSPWTCFGR
jgi:malate synthase